MSTLNDNLLRKFLNGDCTEDELREVHAFIAASPENAEQLFRIEEMYHLGQFNEYSNPQRVARAEKQLEKKLTIENDQIRKRFHIRQWMRYAAIITVILITGATVYFLHQSNDMSELLVASASKGTTKKITLPDGTKVWLNNGSTLKYPANFSESERKVYLDGEAYFEVTKDRKKPFISESEAMCVKVLGTHFNLRSSTKLRIVEATLLEGEIEVKGNNDEGMIILSPGQRAELNKATGRMIVKQVDAKLDVVWHNNMIPFDKADIFDISKTLERFYGVKIILSPDIRANKTYSGVLKRKATIDSVLNSLQNSIPIKYKIAGNNIFISSQTHKNQ